MKRLACPVCGYIPDSLAVTTCPKCDAKIYEARSATCLQFDIAHHGQTVEQALAQIDNALNRAILMRASRIRFVCGYGSGAGHTSIIKVQALHYLRRLAASRGYRVETPAHNPGEIDVILY